MNKTLPFVLPVVRSFLFIIGGLLLVVVTNDSFESLSRWWTLLCIGVNVVTIFTLVLVCKGEKISFLSLIHYKKGELKSLYTLYIILIMLVLGVGSMMLFGVLIYGYIPLTMIQPLPIWLAVINIILLPITIILAEFPLYFGYAVNKIDTLTQKKWLAIGYPMFFYALQHSFIPLLFSWEHVIFRFLSFLPLLMVLGITYYKHRRLAAIMIGHAILDFSVAFQILIISLFPALLEAMSTV